VLQRHKLLQHFAQPKRQHQDGLLMAHELSGQNKETQRKLMQKNRDRERQNKKGSILHSQKNNTKMT
jgi:hypothetical protein